MPEVGEGADDEEDRDDREHATESEQRNHEMEHLGGLVELRSGDEEAENRQGQDEDARPRCGARRARCVSRRGEVARRQSREGRVPVLLRAWRFREK